MSCHVDTSSIVCHYWPSDDTLLFSCACSMAIRWCDPFRLLLLITPFFPPFYSLSLPVFFCLFVLLHYITISSLSYLVIHNFAVLILCVFFHLHLSPFHFHLFLHLSLYLSLMHSHSSHCPCNYCFISSSLILSFYHAITFSLTLYHNLPLCFPFPRSFSMTSNSIWAVLWSKKSRIVPVCHYN